MPFLLLREIVQSYNDREGRSGEKRRTKVREIATDDAGTENSRKCVNYCFPPPTHRRPAVVLFSLSRVTPVFVLYCIDAANVSHGRQRSERRHARRRRKRCDAHICVHAFDLLIPWQHACIHYYTPIYPLGEGFCWRRYMSVDAVACVITNLFFF